MNTPIDLFPDVNLEDGITLPDGWERAVLACLNDAGYEAARELLSFMCWGLPLEWVWGIREEAN